MNALLLFTGHLKGACKDTSFMKHYQMMCEKVFARCNVVMITYRNIYGTVRASRTYSVTSTQSTSFCCIEKMQTLFPNMKIELIDENMDNFTVGNAYTKRYTQMIHNIRKGILTSQNSSDIVIRMRPDGGLSNINAIWSFSTWTTLLNVPHNAIVQYGTWRKRRGESTFYVNGDNCFAARFDTFNIFVTHWEQDFERDYKMQLDTTPELTMNSVCKRYGILLFVNQFAMQKYLNSKP